MKKILVILLCILLLGCAEKTSNSITGYAIKDAQEINCADCDDGDKCTTDICSGEDNACEHVPIRRCCGNEQCELGETCFTCEEDCGSCYTMEQMQKDINKIYGRKIIFTKNKVIGKTYGEVASTDYDFYDSTYVTVIEIKNNDKFFSSLKDFQDFIEGIGKRRFEHFESRLAEQYSEDEYEFITNYTVELTGTLSGDIAGYSYWAKAYKVFYSQPLDNVRGYKTTRLTDPILDSALYVRCAPNLVAGFYSNQPQMLERFWNNLDEEEYDAQIKTWLSREAYGALDEATALIAYCSDKE
ncbi:hypothetical protein KY361_02765 [Candidatus Woesearchaeota archaeon]|nr:hypothetical protein [Candidatus Woesearchaeota archaeon]